ncbi:MAG: S9 family peptidase [Sphingobium limneticum]
MSKPPRDRYRRSMAPRLRVRYISLSLALSALLAPSISSAAPAAEGVRTFEAGDLFSLQRVTDPQISPDAHAVAYVRESFDIMTDRARRAIWLVDTATSTQQPLEAGASSASSPRWSPDGKRLAYVVSEGGRSYIAVRWLENGRTARIADVGDGAEDLRWSPDGRSIAFVMRTTGPKKSLGSLPEKPAGAQWADPLRVITEVTYRRDTEGYLEPGHPHLFVISADGGTARQLTFGAFDDHGPIAWMPDGQALLFSANRNEGWQRDTNSSQIYRVSIGNGALTRLTHRIGPATNPRVSPDGKTIAYLGYDDRMLSYQDSHVYLMSGDGGDNRAINLELNRSIADLQWASDSHSLFIQYADAGTLKAARLTLSGGIKTVATGLAGSQLDRPYTLGAAFSVAPNGAVAFASGSSDAPADLSIARDGRITRLTRLNEALLAGKTLAQTRHLAVRSSFDQRPIDAWLVTPPGFDPTKKYPLILEIHGGPSGSYGGDLFATDMQLYAAAGYIVVYANPRGSSGYGEGFANLIQGDFPGHDYDDLMSVVDAAVAAGSVDPDQMFVTGGSAGGELTAWIVGKTHRFRAAAVQKPVINAISYVLTTDEAGSVPRRWYGKMPWEDVDTYWKHSPLSLVGNVTTPTLIVVGGEDFRTPVSEAEQYYEALQLRGVPTALVEVPHAGHLDLTARPSQSAAKASAILAWFDRYRSALPQQPKADSPSVQQ